MSLKCLRLLDDYKKEFSEVFKTVQLVHWVEAGAKTYTKIILSLLRISWTHLKLKLCHIEFSLERSTEGSGQVIEV